MPNDKSILFHTTFAQVIILKYRYSHIDIHQILVMIQECLLHNFSLLI